MSAKDRAADLLVHYFRIAFQEAGVSWDASNASEVIQIVDLIQDMVRDEIRIALATEAGEPS